MADNRWLNNEPSFSYVPNASLGINLSRQKNAPLDVSSEFKSIEDMVYYVTEGRYPINGVGVSQKVKAMPLYPYLGQIISLVNTDSNSETVVIYYIKTAEALDFTDANLTTQSVFEHYFGAVGIGSATITPISNNIVKYDTYANWVQENPVLDDGEIVLAIVRSNGVLPDEIIFKIGDGQSTFTQLESVKLSSSNIIEQELNFDSTATITSSFTIPANSTIKKIEVLFTNETSISSINNSQTPLITLKNNNTTVKTLIKAEDIDFETISDSSNIPETFIYDIYYSVNANLQLYIDMTSLTGIEGKVIISYKA